MQNTKYQHTHDKITRVGNPAAIVFSEGCEPFKLVTKDPGECEDMVLLPSALTNGLGLACRGQHTASSS